MKAKKSQEGTSRSGAWFSPGQVKRTNRRLPICTTAPTSSENADPRPSPTPSTSTALREQAPRLGCRSNQPGVSQQRRQVDRIVRVERLFGNVLWDHSFPEDAVEGLLRLDRRLLAPVEPDYLPAQPPLGLGGMDRAVGQSGDKRRAPLRAVRWRVGTTAASSRRGCSSPCRTCRQGRHLPPRSCRATETSC